MRGLSDGERRMLNHVCMWGSDGYAAMLQKLRGGRWTWSGFDGVQGPPTVFKTKREAVASLEAFLAVLREAAGEEACARYRAEHPEEAAAFDAAKASQP